VILVPKAFPFIPDPTHRPSMNNTQGKPMAETNRPREDDEPEGTKPQPGSPNAENAGHSVFGMTLEEIIDATGEFQHLNELVVLQIRRSGGLKSPDDYFPLVTPILDLLETEIRACSMQGVTKQQMKLIIQDWIDKEIADVK
jgi:hypothetical protein